MPSTGGSNLKPYCVGRLVHIMLEWCASVLRSDSWMTIHWKCIHTWNSEIVFPTLDFQKETIFDFKLLLFHWRKDASITKTSGDAFLEWFTRCGEAPHDSVREFLGVLYFRPLESKNSVKTAVPSADVNGPGERKPISGGFELTRGQWGRILGKQFICRLHAVMGESKGHAAHTSAPPQG